MFSLIWKRPVIILLDTLSQSVGEQAACQKICLTNWIWSFVPLVEGSAVPEVLERSGIGSNRAGSVGVGISEVWSPGVPAQAIFGASPRFVRGDVGVLG